MIDLLRCPDMGISYGQVVYKGRTMCLEIGIESQTNGGYQFRRQRPVINFIADFMCKELMLVIEVESLSPHSCLSTNLCRSMHPYF